MNREQAKALLPIIQAFAEGKSIQYKYNNHNSKWCDATTTEHERISFENGIDCYRIKPEPREFFLLLNKNGEVIGGNSHGAYIEYQQGADICSCYKVKVREVLEDSE